MKYVSAYMMFLSYDLYYIILFGAFTTQDEISLCILLASDIVLLDEVNFNAPFFVAFKNGLCYRHACTEEKNDTYKAISYITV